MDIKTVVGQRLRYTQWWRQGHMERKRRPGDEEEREERRKTKACLWEGMWGGGGGRRGCEWPNGWMNGKKRRDVKEVRPVKCVITYRVKMSGNFMKDMNLQVDTTEWGCQGTLSKTWKTWEILIVILIVLGLSKKKSTLVFFTYEGLIGLDCC